MKKGSKLLPIIAYLLFITETIFFSFIRNHFGISENNAIFMSIVMTVGMATWATMFLTISWAVKKEPWKGLFKGISAFLWFFTAIAPIFITLYCNYPAIFSSFMHS